MRKYFILALMGIGIGCGCYLSVFAMQQQASDTNDSQLTEVTIETTKAAVESQLVKNSEKIVKSSTEETTEVVEMVESEVEAESESTTEIEIQSASYTDEELYIMSHLIEGEAGGNSWELKIGVGSVVLNRVADNRFPDTIADVVFQSGQYACTWDGNYDKEPCEESVEAAKYLLTYGSQMPSCVIYQAEFKQGNGIYDYFENTYFCYQED